MNIKVVLALAAVAALNSPVDAQSVRSHTRLNPRGTTVSSAQALDLTLTVTPATTRPVQVWVRAAGTVDGGGQRITAWLAPGEATFVKVGQRVRAFPIESRSSMSQARVTRVAPESGRVGVDVTLAGQGRTRGTLYVVEIVTDRGDFFSVPNEALIEEGNRRVVYVQQQEGQYAPREIKTGIQGELYTEVVSGLNEGDLVVTFGSFFIDSEYKLKGTAQAQ